MSPIRMMDPTHPLFGKKLTLLSERCGRGKAFVAVAWQDGRRRLVLRSATDLDSGKQQTHTQLSRISARSLLPFGPARSLLPDGRQHGGTATEHCPDLIHQRSKKIQRNNQPLPRLRRAPPPEAHIRLAQQIARILQRIRARDQVVLITSGEGAKRVTAAHRAKLAYVYVRQPTAGQVRQRRGSTVGRANASRLLTTT
jgi:hypothetical protein